MKHYFELQFELIKRRCREMGFNPLFAFLLLAVGFGVFSWLLFQKSEYGPYIYVFITLTFIVNLSERKRTEFLKITFQNNRWKQIRMIENLIAGFPCIVFLCLKLEFILALMLILLVLVMVIFSFKTGFRATIPTPFSKKPFEFIVGFRSTFFLYFIIYTLALIAVKVDNFNLGVFSIISIFALAMSHFSKPEDEWFVWNYSLNSKQFLFHKIKTGLLQVTLLVIPITLLIAIVYFSEIIYILLFLLAGYSFLICMITAKYSVYPNEMNLIEGILIALSVAFPPLLLIIVPYFFSKSTKTLNTLLQ